MKSLLGHSSKTSGYLAIEDDGDLHAVSENHDINLDVLATTPTFESVTATDVDATTVTATDVVADTFTVGTLVYTDFEAENITATKKLAVWDSQGGGWQDLLGQIQVRDAGANRPSYAQMGTSPFYNYRFAVNDYVELNYHITHEYAPASDIFLHAHWTTNGTNVNPVKWEFTWSYAKGYNQENFGMSGSVVTVSQAAAGTAWRHMIAEISTGISNAGFEVDGIIMVKVRRVTNGATENTDQVFLILSDAHVQCDTVNTRNRNYPFYA